VSQALQVHLQTALKENDGHGKSHKCGEPAAHNVWSHEIRDIGPQDDADDQQQNNAGQAHVHGHRLRQDPGYHRQGNR
jgi:hypothetical protein